MNNKLKAYSAGVVCSVSLHGLLVVALIVGWTPERKQVQIRPQYIQATLLQVEPPKAPVTPPAKQQTKKPPEKDTRQQIAAKQREEQKRKARLREEKLAAEKKAREDKARKDRQRREKEQAEARKRQQEEARKAREEARRREQELAFAEALKDEEAFRNAAADQQLVASYSSYISKRIANNWSRPPSARREMEVTLIIQLVPTGRVISVAVEKSSGNGAFDRSAEQAVHKVERFERLQELSQSSPGLFEKNFRRFRLVFRPDDLRL